MLRLSLPEAATIVTVHEQLHGACRSTAPASAFVPVRPEAVIRLVPFVRQVAVAVVAASTVVFTATQVRPVFLGQAPVADRVLAGVYLDSTPARAPWLSLPEPLAMRHPQFQRDVAAFAADLLGTGNIGPDRADSIARVAVREAYHRRIPPALVFGVMLTENDRFKQNARSKVGALGLMQIMPRLWTPNLGPILGHNLRDDETNLRYGVYILKHFAKKTPDSLDASAVIRTALLSYNGCVRGRNTPDCRAYPEKVRRHVERDGRSICAGQAFHDCVALPLWAALRDTSARLMPTSAAASEGVVASVSDRPSDRPTPARRIARARTPSSNATDERTARFLLGLVGPRAE
jgi:soluble lytic murein transglycosylase-like protein